MHTFFSDGKRSVDFVLVYNLDPLNTDNEKLLRIHTFLTNILNIGLEVELDLLTNNENINFLKIHAPDNILDHFADASNIDLAYKNTDYRPSFSTPWRPFATPVTRIDENNPIYLRAMESVSDAQPKTITNCERILIVSKILSCVKYGTLSSDYGYLKLIQEHVLETGFPLHEPSTIVHDSSPLNDRQLLCKYWASPRMFYKEQPLHLIEKYFGTEVGFYFAWLGVYNKMLIVASIASLICLIYGFATYKTNTISEQICNSDLILCPKCPDCKFEAVRTFCNASYLLYFFENQSTFAFAIFMSFWATFFVEIWKRKESFLKIRWNVKSLEIDMTPTRRFLEQTKEWQIITFTGETINVVPKQILFFRYFITTTSIVFLITLIIFIVFGIMVMHMFLDKTLGERGEFEQLVIKQDYRFLVKLASSFMSAFVIILVKFIYKKVAMFLTDLEFHRTQHQYDNAYIIKWFALAFTNNYAAVFYIAFFKGRFFTYPNDNLLGNKIFGLGTTFCGPTGCIIDLSMQLIAIMTTKTVYRHVKQMLNSLLMYYYKFFKLRAYAIPERTRIEEDYFKIPTDRYFFVNEYVEMVIQYGFVTFFIVGFPIAPILALINNIIELRTDAMKMTYTYRRLVPDRVSGLGAWLTILQLMTYISVTTNAMIVAFTGQFVDRLLYQYSYEPNLKGFLNWTMSAYDVQDFRYQNMTVTTCYYPHMRFPSGHEREYELREDYWYVLAVRWGTVLAFIHVVFLLAAIIAYAIPDMPFFVKENIKYREKLNRQYKRQAISGGKELR